MPHTLASVEDPQIAFCVELHPDHCTAAAGTTQADLPDYMGELKSLARKSGKRFEVILKDVMSQIKTHLDTLEPSGDEEEEEEEKVDSVSLMSGQQGATGNHNLPLVVRFLTTRSQCSLHIDTLSQQLN